MKWLLVAIMVGGLGNPVASWAAEEMGRMTVVLDQSSAASAPTSDAKALETVRATIDGIDAQILDLLAQRFEAVQRVRQIKGVTSGDVPPLRPSREAEVMRALLDARRDPLPPGVAIAIWRELMGSSTQLQKITRIYLPSVIDDGSAFRDAVKANFGSLAPLRQYSDAHSAAEAARADRASLAAVPARSSGWARSVMSGRNAGYAVVARIPFVEAKADTDGFVLGHVPSSPTGDDQTLVAISGSETSTVDSALVRELWEERDTDSRGGRLWLGVLEGWLDDEAASKAVGAASNGGLEVEVLGRYATPIH